ncbi:hypothetical protein F0L74_24735 [Chitinophaga agrisoli]|uniref:Glycosyl transferase family 2 n=1 Tax=Chitinophaga agrisoli TaxID=2607653 RepID=A0A5B2VM72_9BACT|nr:glycosyltransferase [Chitinophaga agrisoli]KAA2239412.1 hypothetical protein F0L74_24735 [Chitinophaga agrisoli]
MQIYKKPILEDFLDVSIIIPLQEKLETFRRLLPINQSKLQRNGVEVVVVLYNEATAQDLIALIQDYPTINWKIIAAGSDNYCTALNTGIRRAANQYIMTMDPAAELYTDVIYQCRYMLQHHPAGFAAASGITASIDVPIHSKNLFSYRHTAYSSIMVLKSAVEEIQGYDTSCLPSAAHGNLASRLQLTGAKQIMVQQALVIQRFTGHDNQTPETPPDLAALIKKMRYPPRALPTGNSWEQSAGNVLSDWKQAKNNQYSQQLLTGICTHHYIMPQAFEKQYKVIALIQTRNESNHIPEVLHHLCSHCDGIILLDDGSTDDTYEKAASEKLILKAKKAYKGYFDDLANRNQLLQLGYLFNADWFYFMDADERFAYYPDISDMMQDDRVDVIGFKLSHLWNSDTHYRTDLPEGKDGVLHRYRMFRNKGFAQIIAKRELHFPSVPYRQHMSMANVLIKHYGLMDNATRARKYDSYRSQDSDGKKQGYNYDYLLDESPVLASFQDLVEALKQQPVYYKPG